MLSFDPPTWTVTSTGVVCTGRGVQQLADGPLAVGPPDEAQRDVGCLHRVADERPRIEILGNGELR
jgi:hypothetical protein